MIVVHPKDPSTKMLSLIYKDIKDVTLLDSWEQTGEEPLPAASEEENW